MAMIAGCGPSETEKRNAVMSGLVAQKNAIEKETSAYKLRILKRNDSLLKAAKSDPKVKTAVYDSLDSQVLTLEAEMEKVQKQIDSLSLLK